jgi:hypothetical protein
MKKIFTSKVNSILLIFLIVIVIVAIVLTSKKNLPFSSNNNTDKLEILGNKENLLSFSIVPGMSISGEIAYIGNIEGGYFFEGNILINILNKNKEIIKESFANATFDWMTSGPVAFQGFLDVSNLEKGPAFVQILQDDPSGGESGLPARQILIPIIID